jgi:hypothetical protein
MQNKIFAKSKTKFFGLWYEGRKKLYVASYKLEDSGNVIISLFYHFFWVVKN